MTWLTINSFAIGSIAPRVRSPVADLAADLSAAFDALGVEWYLFGAQAAIVYGVARLTADVDVTVRVPERISSAALAEALARRGYRLLVRDSRFLEHSRVLPFVHEPTSLGLDVVLAGPGIEDEFFSRVTRHDIDGVHVPVADVTDLVVMKVLAGRPRDQEDVAALLRIQLARIDVERARATLRLLESALAQSDLLPAFEQALARAQRRV
jgi:hypothetical protein